MIYNLCREIKLTLVVMALLFMPACWDSMNKVFQAFHLLGGVAIVLAIVLYALRHKIAGFIKKGNTRKFILVFFLLLFLTEGRVFAADISFEPAVSTFLKICKSFANITAGACGFYGLTRVGWLLVNEDRSCGTALIMSIMGYVSCTIAAGLLPAG